MRIGMGWVIYYSREEEREVVYYLREENNILLERRRALSDILPEGRRTGNILYGESRARYGNRPLSQFWKKFRKASENFRFCENSEILVVLRKF